MAAGRGYCSLPFKRMKINSDGEWHSCCHQSITYGNLVKDNLTVEEAFNNNVLKDVQQHVLEGKLHPICNTSRCPFYTVQDDLKNHVEEIEEINPTQPDDIELALPSKHCNIGGTNPTADTACSMCPRASQTFMSWEPPVDLTDVIVAKLKPYMDKIRTVNVQGIAEPFWKGKVIEILDELDFKKHQHNTWFWSFTNGTVFGDKIQDEFINNVRWGTLGFSVDAATPETYIKIRKLNFFSTIERNIKRFVKKAKSYTHEERYYHLFTTFNINMLNVHEVVEMVRWSHSLGVDRAEFTLTFNGSPEFIMGEENLCNQDNWPIFWQAQQDAIKVAEELGFKVDFYVPFHGGFLEKC